MVPNHLAHFIYQPNLSINVGKRRNIVFSRGEQVSSCFLSLFTSSAPRSITKAPRATRVPRIFLISLPLPICRHTHEPSQPASLVVCSLSPFSTVSRLPREHSDFSRFFSLSSDRRETIEKGESVVYRQPEIVARQRRDYASQREHVLVRKLDAKMYERENF